MTKMETKYHFDKGDNWTTIVVNEECKNEIVIKIEDDNRVWRTKKDAMAYHNWIVACIKELK